MIPDFFLDMVFNLLELLLSALPEINIPTDWSVTSTFFGIVRSILYLLPLGTIGAIIGILIAISAFRILISIVKTIWDLLPIV